MQQSLSKKQPDPWFAHEGLLVQPPVSQVRPVQQAPCEAHGLPSVAQMGVLVQTFASQVNPLQQSP